MKDPINIKLSTKQAAIIAELFSNGDAETIAELLKHVTQSARHRLAEKIRSEMEYAKFRRAVDIARRPV